MLNRIVHTKRVFRGSGPQPAQAAGPRSRGRTFASPVAQGVALGLMAATLAAATGCATTAGEAWDSEDVSNSERLLAVWEGENERFIPALCLEYSTAVGEEHQRKLDLGTTFGEGQSVSLSYQAATNLAQIYTVSDIMQFGHAAMYRLCEAQANGMITSTQYYELLSRLFASISGLLLIQNSAGNLEAIKPLREAVGKILTYQNEIHALELKQERSELDQSEAQRLGELKKQLDAAYKSYYETVNDLSTFDVPKDTDAPTQSDKAEEPNK